MLVPLHIYCGIREVKQAIPHIKELDIGIEVVLDTTEDLWPQPKWENLLSVADKIAEVEMNVTVHGPFYGLNLGVKDDFIRDYSLQVLKSGVEFARAVGSPLMVFHSGFLPQLPPRSRKKWFELFGEGLQELLEHAYQNQVVLAMENTYEPEPEILEEIFETFAHPNLRMCLDTGHATCFGKVDPAEWPARFADKICHVHLSDNDGKDDLHQALGTGKVNFQELLSPLRDRDVSASLTMEVSAEDAAKSKEYLTRLLQSAKMSAEAV